MSVQSAYHDMLLWKFNFELNPGAPLVNEQCSAFFNLTMVQEVLDYTGNHKRSLRRTQSSSLDISTTEAGRPARAKSPIRVSKDLKWNILYCYDNNIIVNETCQLDVPDYSWSIVHKTTILKLTNEQLKCKVISSVWNTEIKDFKHWNTIDNTPAPRFLLIITNIINRTFYFFLTWYTDTTITRLIINQLDSGKCPSVMSMAPLHIDLHKDNSQTQNISSESKKLPFSFDPNSNRELFSAGRRSILSLSASSLGRQRSFNIDPPDSPRQIEIMLIMHI